MKSLTCETPSLFWLEKLNPKLCHLPTEEEHTESSGEMTERHLLKTSINGIITRAEDLMLDIK